LIKMSYKVVVTSLITLALLASSCSENEGSKISGEKTFYRDLPAFFKQEVQRLKTQEPNIQKTVEKDKEQETKEVQINDWNTELSSFLNIDLNKVNYQNQLLVDSTDSVIIYTAINPNIDIQKVEITLDPQGEINAIDIYKISDNTLYKSTETLHYNKEEGYRIEKEQDIRFLGKNNYKITGSF